MLDRILARLTRRDPDFIIGGAEQPYLKRWWLIPRNRVFNIYLHNMLRDDDDRALHDHPWWNVSIILRGGYDEHMPKFPREWPWNRDLAVQARRAGQIVLRRANAVHRLTLPTGNAESWSLFITGPVVRHWGFWCPNGWRFWREFVDGRDAGAVGRGCE